MHAPYRGHRIVPAASADVPPLDGMAVPLLGYSFRKLRTAYAGPAIRIRRASDNAETDIGFLGYVPGIGAPWDVAAATSHCNATTCFVRTWYNQGSLAATGNIEQATAASQEALIFNCNGSLPCVRNTSGVMAMSTVANITPATGVVSLSAVAKRTGTAACHMLRFNGNTGNRIQGANALVNTWSLVTSATPLTAAVTDGAWHAVQGVINAAASVVRVDATETTGTVSPASTVAGTAGYGGGATTTCDKGELVAWDNVANDAAARAFLATNQKSFWGTP